MNTLNFRFSFSLESITNESDTLLVNVSSSQETTFEKVKHYNNFLIGVENLFHKYMEEMREK